jgi:hypothetical protein
MWIPDLEDAAQYQLRFHHASFQDFLLDPNRSGGFFIDQQTALMDIVMSSIYWCDIDAMHFHTNDSKHTKTFVKLVLMIFRVGF